MSTSEIQEFQVVRKAILSIPSSLLNPQSVVLVAVMKSIKEAENKFIRDEKIRVMMSMSSASSELQTSPEHKPDAQKTAEERSPEGFVIVSSMLTDNDTKEEEDTKRS